MKSKQVLLTFLLTGTLLVVGCSPSPAEPGSTSTAGTVSVATAPAPATAVAQGATDTSAAPAPTDTPGVEAATETPVFVMTAVVGTVLPDPGGSHSPVPTFTPLFSPAPGTPPQAVLKYDILARFGDIFFCDPDYYPVARVVEPDQIAARVAQIQATPDYPVILNHLGIPQGTVLTQDQMAQVYAESKKLNAIPLQPVAGGYQFTVRVGQARSGTAITGTIDQRGNITVTNQQSTILTCPICLTAGTQIATPLGAIPVEELHIGAPVWTADLNGTPQLAIVERTVAAPYSANALLVRLTLADGRALLLSPAHPLPGGRTAASLMPGSHIGDTSVSAVEWVPSGSGVTYDILPFGSTGEYWANGVLLGSTLK